MSIETMKAVDIALNLVIFVITLVLVAGCFRKDGKWAPERGRYGFRFFTTQSNVLCACASLLTAVFLLSGDLPRWAWTLKYAGTAAVTVTMLTVLFFLWPSIGKDGPKVLLTGSPGSASTVVMPRSSQRVMSSLLGTSPTILRPRESAKARTFSSSPTTLRWLRMIPRILA